MHEDNTLMLGDLIGHTKRMVIACTKMANRDPAESFARWIAICVKEGEYHPYVVWDVFARPQGWHAASGDYAFTIEEAVVQYKKRGGHG